jgi:glycosyltransferase involved in cell wall biosynthesis
MSEPNLEETRGRRLKILHIAGWYPSKRNPVAGIFVREHVKATALYNDVVVLYSEGVDREIRGLYQIEDNIEDGIRTLRLRYRKSPIPKTTYFIYLWAMFRAFAKLIEEGFRPDVIHAHIYSAGVPAVLLGMWHRIPVVITEHSTAFPRGLIRGFERIKAKFAFERAAVVCPVSEDLRKHIERLGVRTRFQVIPNVVDTSLFSPLAACKAKDKGKKRLLTVALLDPKKGIPYLLEALAQLRERRDDFVLDIVGDGPNRAEYEELTRKLGLQDIVHFHGLKTKQEVAEFMRKADVFVLPSEWENLPCVIIEAMASGLPIVATDVGGIPEIVSNEVGILVQPKNVLALAEVLNKMLENLAYYQREKIAQQAKQRFSYETIGQMLDNLYRNLIVAKGG